MMSGGLAGNDHRTADLDGLQRILVVDDDEIDRMQIRRLLSRSGIRASLVEADTVALARRYLGDGGIDLVLLDQVLPGEDGLALLAHGSGTIPVVVLTGQGDEELAVAVMKAGAADYLIKGSLTPERLATTLGNVWRRSVAESERQRAAAALQASSERSRALGACARSLLLDTGTPGALAIALRPLLPVLATDRLQLYRNDEVDGEPGWRLRAQVAVDGQAGVTQTACSWLAGWRSWKLALSTGGTVQVVVAEMPAPPVTDLIADGCRACIAVPLYLAGRWQGFLRADRCRSAEPFGDEAAFLLQSAGDLAAAWIERYEPADQS